ncbi:MAG: hypothetical protein FJ190_06450 [Gammaproteobacteria bacterium]|nr:hypothetical protein [Gammaproteobacteria bacterium]
MKTQITHLEQRKGINATADAPTASGRDHREKALHPLLLISRLFFAVFVVGFIGYYFDRLLQFAFFKADRDRRTQS